MKRIFVFLITLLFATTLFSQTFYKSLEPGKNMMAVYVGSYDWGACINKIVIHTEEKYKPESLKLSDFEVERVLYQKDTGLRKTNGELKVIDVFCSDSKGNKIEEESSYITILTDVYPEAENSNPFPGFISNTMFENFYSYQVENDDLDFKITKVQGFVNEDVSKFSKGVFTFKGETEKKVFEIPMNYMFYLPETKSPERKLPLILWFHSIGESGSNPYLVLLGTKTTALAGEKIQSYFEDGVAILAPQCPSGWLETIEENSMGIRYWAPVDIEGSVKKFTNPIKKFFDSITGIIEEEKEEEKEPFAAVSFYTEPVTELLMDFLKKHPEIDSDRIYVGGCSAGGYMTMNMMIQHPELFIAAFPTCEYYLDSKITNKQIKALAEKPLWFTYAENDETVKPASCSIPTIKRLRKADAKNLKVTVFPNVVDTSGTVFKNRNADEDDDDFGKPYEYDGHSSWIYVLNDQCYDGDESLFDWLSRQR